LLIVLRSMRRWLCVYHHTYSTGMSSLRATSSITSTYSPFSGPSAFENGRLSGSAQTRSASALAAGSAKPPTASAAAKARALWMPRFFITGLLTVPAQLSANTNSVPPSGLAATIFSPSGPKKAGIDSVRPETTATYCLPSST
jgi:hypothetical protein